MPQLLAVSGSLRSGSSSTSLLTAVAQIAPSDTVVALFQGMADIPAFSPDRDVEPPPPPVVTWRAALATADGVVFSTPEYAHGIPGALKNALDWVVGSGELYNKPVALLNPSPESAFAHPQLAEVLRTMGARLSEDTVVTVRVPRVGASPEAIIADATIAASVRAALGALFAG